LVSVYNQLKEEDYKLEFLRLSLPDDRAPSIAELEALVAAFKDSEEGTAFIFNDQIGKERVTLGMVLAGLFHRAKTVVAEPAEEEPEEEKEPEPEPEEEPEEEEPEEEEDEDEEDEVREARLKAKEEKKQAKLKAKEDKLKAKAEKEAREAKEREDAEKEDDEIPLNPKLGQFTLIMKLVRTLAPRDKKDFKKAPGQRREDKAAKLKAAVDDVIDRCKHVVHLRDQFIDAKEQYDKADGAQKAALKAVGQNLVERYFYLIVFFAYLKEAIAAEFATPFSKWVDEHPQLFALLGTRQAGPLADFAFA